MFAPGAVGARRSLDGSLEDEVDASEDSARALEAFFEWYYGEAALLHETIHWRAHIHTRSLSLSLSRSLFLSRSLAPLTIKKHEKRTRPSMRRTAKLEA